MAASGLSGSVTVHIPSRPWKMTGARGTAGIREADEDDEHGDPLDQAGARQAEPHNSLPAGRRQSVFDARNSRLMSLVTPPRFGRAG